MDSVGPAQAACHIHRFAKPHTSPPLLLNRPSILRMNDIRPPSEPHLLGGPANKVGQPPVSVFERSVGTIDGQHARNAFTDQKQLALTQQKARLGTFTLLDFPVDAIPFL